MAATKKNPDSKKHPRPLAAILSYSAWLAFVFLFSQLLVVAIFSGLEVAGWDFSGVNQNIFNVSIGALSYVLMLALTIGVPKWLMKQVTTLKELGIQRTVSWLDIGLALAGMVTYFILSAVLVSLADQFLPWFDLEQVQETGVSAPQRGLELAVAFTLFVVAAPLVEELLFRGYLYGKFRANGVSFWLATLVVSALFGLAHGQWNVAIDTFALSVVLCVAREVSGAVWPAVIMHMMKNGIAFYFLFVNPQLLESLM